jgi:acyl-homoserine-lactone acylase
MRKSFRAAFLPLLFVLTAASPPELVRWRSEAVRVTITRDDWGIAHVHGQSDADAVFGMIYAQAEDDFPRIEANYLTALGRAGEADGEKAIWADLRARLYVSEAKLKADYARSPAGMRKLMDAWADGLNYFLATHPGVHPRVLKRFEPWMVMSFTEGSIGGDIEKIKLDALQDINSSSTRVRGEVAARSADGGVLKGPHHRLRRSPSPANAGEDEEKQASNGIAIAPGLTSDGHALLLINPHTSFYFRSEAQVSSDEGLDAYGASTWGQFFIYQGFNPHAGWMHTSSGIDNVDEFAEVIENGPKGRCYRYGATCRPVDTKPITIRYRLPDGRIGSRTFTTYFTHRGPVVRSENDRWISFAMMDRPIEALQQSFLRTKATDLASFMRIAQLKANSSNDTIFADDKGEVAYLHPQFVPSRNDRFDYTKPVDGSDPTTDWGVLHGLSSLPNSINPPNGWVQNTNAWPYRAAGAYSPDPRYFPKYMDMVGENFRGEHAQQMLTKSRGWTLERLQAAAYDSYQPGFAELVPALLRAFDAMPASDSRRARLAAPIAMLRSWDYRWSTGSVAQTLAVLSGEALIVALDPPPGEDKNRYMNRLARDTTDAQKLAALDDAVTQLQRDFGHWQVPWGEINRFQRASPSIAPQFSDDAPSIPVPFAAAKYGSLASIEMRVPKTTKRFYGNYGNSFVAVVEFGPRVRAKAITAGGESGDPKSPHFNDEAQRYASGALRDVYFYPDQLNGHTERAYHPGEELQRH